MKPATQPNILFVTTDQQRFDTCGPFKPPFMCTPHFDRLADEGVLFRSGYSACPLCVPARIEMLTGKHTTASREGVLARQPSIKPEDKTLPMYLRELGYHTSFIGKMHVGRDRVRYGFDEVTQPDAYYRYMERHAGLQQPMRHGMGQNELYPAMATVPENMTLTSWIAEQCVEFIRYRRDPSMPFFLWCSFSKPHPPLDPPEPYHSMYRNSTIPEPVRGDWRDDGSCPAAIEHWTQMQGYDKLTPEVIRAARAAYYGLITQIDYNIGRILAVLTDSALIEDTLIVYTSDHGEYLGDHGMGAKCFFHEPSAHVPFLLRPPLSWNAGLEGTVCDTAVTHVDILPTLVRAAGGKAPAGEGMDLLALLQGELAEPRRYVDGMECENQYWFGDFAPCDYVALTDGRWKYIYYFEGPAEQLFDLAADPQELHNLAGWPEHAAVQAEMRAELIRRHAVRGTTAVQDGTLVQVPVLEVEPHRARSGGWPGYHSELAPGDIRH